MKAIVLFFTIIISNVCFSQTTLSGKVTDEKGMPLEGANVFLEGTYDGTSSDAKGNFSFTTTTKGTQIIKITFLNFISYSATIEVNNFKNKVIQLKESSNSLDTVVITAGTLESGDKARVSVLKPLDIVTTAGNPGDIISALLTLPGTQTVGESGKLFVRGGEADETQTFIDGIRVAQPYLQTANNLPTRSRFSPFLFKGTTFSTGGYSAEYGEALSSVLLLNTIDEPDQEKTDMGMMTVGLGLGNTQKWKKNSFSFNTNYINLAPYQALFPDKVSWNKTYQSLGGESVFRHNFKEGLLKVYVAFDAGQFDLNQDNINYVDKIRVQSKNNNFYTNVSYKGNLGNDWKLVTGISYGNNQNKGSFDITDFSNKEDASHIKAKVSKSFSNSLKTAFGTDYFFTHYSENGLNSTLGYTSNIAALFSETDILFSKNLVAKLGVRATKNYLLSEFALDPRASLAYKIAKNSQFSFAYGLFEQAPRQDYLKYNTQFQSEKTQHYILNFQYNKDKQTFRAEAYYKKYEDLVKYETTSSMFTLSNFNNNGSGFAKGLDLFWRDNKNVKNVEYWISYSYIDTKRDYKNFPKLVTPNFVADHTLSVVGKYWMPKWRSQLGVTYSFSSGRPYNNPNEAEFMNGRTKSYNNLSVNWAYLISPQKILFFSITNVAGFKNIYGYDYANSPVNGVYQSQPVVPAADRFFFIGFFWTISKDKKTNQLENL
jgi:outer membrane cobalamin receptor